MQRPSTNRWDGAADDDTVGDGCGVQPASRRQWPWPEEKRTTLVSAGAAEDPDYWDGSGGDGGEDAGGVSDDAGCGVGFGLDVRGHCLSRRTLSRRLRSVTAGDCSTVISCCCYCCYYCYCY